jgi:protoporphyrinogen oxidase
MVKEGRTCLGLEYFVFENDEMWMQSDDELVAFATAELERLGLVTKGAVESGHVVRITKAYPTYDEAYQSNVQTLRSWLEEHVVNVHPIGRNGMHRYNNQDHSMMTAVLTAENIALGTSHDVWSVNVEMEYSEEKSSGGTGRAAPIVHRRAASHT